MLKEAQKSTLMHVFMVLSQSDFHNIRGISHVV